MKNKNARLSCFRESGNDREIFICGEESEKKPIGIFLFALKSEFQKSEENGEKRRKPEKISGFLLGIFLVKTHWRRHPDGAFAPIGSPIPPYGSNKKSTPYGVLFLLARVDKKDANEF